MRILLTGGSGFIGRNIQEKAGQTHEIFAPAHDELDLLDEGAVRQYLRKNAFEAVVHCATWDAKWNSRKDLALVLDHNLRMFYNLAREQASYGKLICLGSGADFSQQHWAPFMTEEYFDSYVPADPYGFSKYVITKQIGQLDKAYNLRLFGVFGQHEDWRTRFISNAICRAIYDLPIVIHQDVAYDYLYVDDLIKIIEWFLRNDPKEKTYNVCTNTANLLSALAEMVQASLGKRLPVEVIKPGLGREYSGNNSRLRSELKELKFVPIRESIRELCLWYTAHRDLIPYQTIKENARIAFLAQEQTND